MGWKTNGPWEYLVVELSIESINKRDDQLNAYGRDRWELVSIVETNGNDHFDDTIIAYLKRPKSND